MSTSCIIVTPRSDDLQSFSEGLKEQGVSVTMKPDAETLLAAIRKTPVNLVVVDQELPESDPVRLIMDILTVDATIQTAVLTPLSEEDFHEASEGLGVLKGLPIQPQALDGKALGEQITTMTVG